MKSKKNFFRYRALFIYQGQSRWNLLKPCLYEILLAVVNLVAMTVVGFFVALFFAFILSGEWAVVVAANAWVLCLVYPSFLLGKILVQAVLAPFFVDPNTKLFVVTHMVRVGNLDVYRMPKVKPTNFTPYITSAVANGIPRDEADALFCDWANKPVESLPLPETMPDQSRVILNVPQE